MADIELTQGDVGVVITKVVRDAAGNPITLAGATSCVLRAWKTTTPGVYIINGAATPAADQVVNMGQWSYTTTANDEITTGVGTAELEVQWGGGTTIRTFPNPVKMTLNIAVDG